VEENLVSDIVRVPSCQTVRFIESILARAKVTSTTFVARIRIYSVIADFHLLISASGLIAIRDSHTMRGSIATEELLVQDSPHEAQIARDITRTFTSHSMFREKGGVGQRRLFNVVTFHTPCVDCCFSILANLSACSTEINFIHLLSFRC
jgi:hypothetical protein